MTQPRIKESTKTGLNPSSQADNGFQFEMNLENWQKQHLTFDGATFPINCPTIEVYSRELGYLSVIESPSRTA